ncbi:hypothetical protein J7W19_03855 [Streptomyces mobaraensis NBRC 13819 = DSM 40847]|uniref:Uncharacterized protein n=1 Tax=Streptomyces mobaraensis (strain ATCC 29032 / DSM 40847 / JCM 4168 / NBRC 13819 / NCIMB 11159 / IPCR 16-22) TaxID=1223523 RepID=M3CDZ8_STRM1|nr:hypothetical protein [Streptomyces mobaraensis]EMF02236.1 hypothetical protein H340_02009 [Streptomyces mobaraensis NBRC 13819 = DSM 40847]QTT72686.1 hypothetical protein J7W19_03855 [Streptomyces mobaraensis NBRC 13819 = DSM 40847]
MTHVRKRVVLTAATAVLGGVLATTPSMAAPADAGGDAALKTTYVHVWGPAKISAAYLNSHGKQWQSQNYTMPRPANTARVKLQCWNNGDGGKAQVQIKDMTLNRVLGGSGFQPCDWKPHYAVSNYYTNHQIRVLLKVKGKAHTVDVTAERGY